MSENNYGALMIKSSLTGDLNKIGDPRDAGVYFQIANDDATSANNYPAPLAGVLLAMPSAYGLQQEYTAFSDGKKFIRGLSGKWNGVDGPWMNWVELATEGSVANRLNQKQPLDATLTALAGLVTGANKLPYFTGVDTASQTDLTQVGRDIIGKPNIAGILNYLGLDRVKQRSNETIIYAGDDHAAYFAIRIDGQWGIYDPVQGFIPLGVQQGGTGARDADGAKKNLELDRIQQRPGETVMFSDATKKKFVTARSDNTWGFYNDDQQTFIALPVNAGGTGSLNAAGARTNLGLGAVATEDKVPLTKGGTGATDATGARINLSLDRIEQRPNETVIFGDAFKDKYLTARTDNSWGYYNTSLGKFIPLSVVAGGTGANDAPTARNNLGMGNAATGHVRTGKISMAGDKFFSTPFPNECTAITFGVLIGQTWMFSPYVTYLTKAGFGFDGRCWSGVTGTDAQPFGEEVYYIAWGN
nr:pyocin knob domain-containing protein [Pseudescherichia sp.]